MSQENSKTTGTETASVNAPQRVITVITSRGERRKIPFAGTRWGDLKSIMEKGGTDANGDTYPRYDLSNMKCAESVRKSTLEHVDAEIPDGDFNLFLMPYKTKSGATDRAEAYAAIQKAIKDDGEKATSHFNAEKNYTTKKTVELQELLTAYGVTSAVAATKPIKPAPDKIYAQPTEGKKKERLEGEKSKAIANVVDSISDSKKEKGEVEESLESKVGRAITLLGEIFLELVRKSTVTIPVSDDTKKAAPVVEEPSKPLVEQPKADAVAEVAKPTQAEIDATKKKEQEQIDADNRRKQQEEDQKKKIEADRKKKADDDAAAKEVKDFMKGFGGNLRS